MVRIRDVACAVLAFGILAGMSRPAAAGPITLTGNVAADFTAANGSVYVPIDQGPGVIAGPTGSTAGELPAGVFIQNVALNYNASTDTLYVGIQGYQNVNGQEEIFGDDSGNLNPANDQSPNFTGVKSFALTFAPVSSGSDPSTETGIIAGIPYNKSIEPSNTIDGFTVSKYNGSTELQNGFGSVLSGAGNLAFNPSAAHPDAEFTINNFSKISGINPADGLYLQVYASDSSAFPDPITGTQTTDGPVQTSQPILVPSPQGINTPEPATWLAWLLISGGAGWQYRRRIRSARA